MKNAKVIGDYKGLFLQPGIVFASALDMMVCLLKRREDLYPKKGLQGMLSIQIGQSGVWLVQNRFLQRTNQHLWIISAKS